MRPLSPLTQVAHTAPGCAKIEILHTEIPNQSSLRAQKQDKSLKRISGLKETQDLKGGHVKPLQGAGHS